MNIEIVSVEERRDIVPLKDPNDPNRYAELAVGETRHRAFVRAPSGKLYAVDVPAELADELQS